MAITTTLHRSLHLLLTRCVGALSEQDGNEDIVHIDTLCAGMTALNQLVDVRPVGDMSALSALGLRSIADRERGRPWAEGGLLALLVASPLAFGTGRIYESTVGSVRRGVLITRSADDAIAWLGYRGDDAARVQALLEAEDAARPS